MDPESGNRGSAIVQRSLFSAKNYDHWTTIVIVQKTHGNSKANIFTSKNELRARWPPESLLIDPQPYSVSARRKWRVQETGERSGDYYPSRNVFDTSFNLTNEKKKNILWRVKNSNVTPPPPPPRKYISGYATVPDDCSVFVYTARVYCRAERGLVSTNLIESIWKFCR